MIVRWAVTAVADAATRFRRIQGAREGLLLLVLALRAHAPSVAVDHHVKQA
jgi:hypothetical protein